MGNKMHRGEYHKKIQLMLTCTGEWVDESDVEFENIEEDNQGRDILTFRCPVCAEYHKSVRRG